MPISLDTTFGVEVEVPKLPRETIDQLHVWLPCKFHDDGSLRAPTYLAGNLPVYPQTNDDDEPILSAGMKIAKSVGLEIITEPLAYKELLNKMRKFAYNFAHIPANSRASIHVHVDADRLTWKEVQRLIIWARALEAIIFRLSCGGDVHRGAKLYQGIRNDHKFARPLSNPIGVEWDFGDVGPLINWKELVAAKNATDFVASWGRLDLYWREGAFEHYWPHRLHMINLASILRQGTIEWRIFDGMYEYVDRFVELVYRIHALSEKGEPDFQFDLGSTPDIDARWVSDLLEMDVSDLWGNNWQAACVHTAPRSHYANAPRITSRSQRGLLPIKNRLRADSGKLDHELYIRER